MKTGTVINVVLIAVGVLLLLGALNNILRRSGSESQSTGVTAATTVPGPA